MLESIPFYPLAAVLFLGAGLLFALQMARHLRVFAAQPVKLDKKVVLELVEMNDEDLEKEL